MLKNKTNEYLVMLAALFMNYSALQGVLGVFSASYYVVARGF